MNLNQSTSIEEIIQKLDNAVLNQKIQEIAQYIQLLNVSNKNSTNQQTCSYLCKNNDCFKDFIKYQDYALLIAHYTFVTEIQISNPKTYESIQIQEENQNSFQLSMQNQSKQENSHFPNRPSINIDDLIQNSLVQSKQEPIVKSDEEEIELEVLNFSNDYDENLRKNAALIILQEQEKKTIQKLKDSLKQSIKEEQLISSQSISQEEIELKQQQSIFDGTITFAKKSVFSINQDTQTENDNDQVQEYEKKLENSRKLISKQNQSFKELQNDYQQLMSKVQQLEENSKQQSQAIINQQSNDEKYYEVFTRMQQNNKIFIQELLDFLKLQSIQYRQLDQIIEFVKKNLRNIENYILESLNLKSAIQNRISFGRESFGRESLQYINIETNIPQVPIIQEENQSQSPKPILKRKQIDYQDIIQKQNYEQKQMQLPNRKVQFNEESSFNNSAYVEEQRENQLINTEQQNYKFKNYETQENQYSKIYQPLSSQENKSEYEITKDIQQDFNQNKVQTDNTFKGKYYQQQQREYDQDNKNNQFNQFNQLQQPSVDNSYLKSSLNDSKSSKSNQNKSSNSFKSTLMSSKSSSFLQLSSYEKQENLKYCCIHPKGVLYEDDQLQVAISFNENSEKGLSSKLFIGNKSKKKIRIDSIDIDKELYFIKAGWQKQIDSFKQSECEIKSSLYKTGDFPVKCKIKYQQIDNDEDIMNSRSTKELNFILPFCITKFTLNTQQNIDQIKKRYCTLKKQFKCKANNLIVNTQYFQDCNQLVNILDLNDQQQNTNLYWVCWNISGVNDFFIKIKIKSRTQFNISIATYESAKELATEILQTMEYLFT